MVSSLQPRLATWTARADNDILAQSDTKHSYRELRQFTRDPTSTVDSSTLRRDYIECAETWFDYVLRRTHHVKKELPMQWTIHTKLAKDDDVVPQTPHVVTLLPKISLTGVPLFLHRIGTISDQQNTSSAKLPDFDGLVNYQNPLYVAAQAYFMSISKEGAVITPANADTENQPSDQPDRPWSDGCDLTSTSSANHYASAVYPTPPDGLGRPVAPVAVPSSDPSLDAARKILELDREAMTLFDSPTMPTDIPNDRISYRNAGADLVDVDMLEIKHLTDADFDFFDPPDKAQLPAAIDPHDVTETKPAHDLGSTSEFNTSSKPNENDVDTSMSEDQQPATTLTPPLSPIAVKAFFQQHAVSTQSQSSNGTAFGAVEFHDTLHFNMAKYREAGKFGRGLASDVVGRYDKTACKRIKRSSLHRTTRPYSEQTQSAMQDQLQDQRNFEDDMSDREAVSLPVVRVPGSSCDTATAPNGARQSAHDTPPTAANQTHGPVVPQSVTEDGAINLLGNSTFKFSPKDLVAVAQLVAHQRQAPAIVTSDPFSCPERFPDAMARQLRQVLFDSSRGKMRDYTLSDFAALTQNVWTSARASRGMSTALPRRVSAPHINTNAQHTNHLYVLPPPLLRMRRADDEWDLLSSVMDYWETLCLGPVSLAKDVIPYVALVGNVAFKSAAQNFFEALGTKYESCKFGTHAFENRSDPAISAEMPVAGSPTVSKVFHALHRACTELVSHICTSVHTGTSTKMLYVIDPFETKEMSPLVCGCAHTAISRCREQSSKIELSLRVIPASAIIAYANFHIVETETKSNTLGMLARLTYDALPRQRCTKAEQMYMTASPYKMHAAPSISLASTLPRKLNFQLHASAPVNLLQEAQILHVAYCISKRQDWLSVAWTDNLGKHQDMKHFCLRNANPVEVLTDVRDVTRSLMSDRSTWRVMIAKVGSIPAAEDGVWAELCSTLTAVTLLDVSVPSSLPMNAMTQLDCVQEFSKAGTPKIGQLSASTLSTADVAAPAVISNAVGQSSASEGKAAEAAGLASGLGMSTIDPDWQLVDLTDETYGMILAMSATNLINVHHPKMTLASGLMLKRGGRSDVDRLDGTLQTIGVDVITDHPPKAMPRQEKSWLQPRSAEGTLRDVLGWYRGLALLARVQGVRGAEAGHVPWHVATAINGAEVLDDFFNSGFG